MKKIAVFTSGGDAPGMNACIRAVVLTGIQHGLEVVGIMEGFKGMIKGDFCPLNTDRISNIIQRSGTILKSARCQAFRTKEGRKLAYQQLQKEGIEGIIAIGGDGTFTGADIFMKEYPDLKIVGCPGTIDNDLYGTDFTIGYDTAVNTAMQAIDKIRETANSHNRLFFAEVMGRDVGYIALRSGIATGADAILLPESLSDTQLLIDVLKASYQLNNRSIIVVVAEGDEMGGALTIAKKVGKQFKDLDTRVSILGHIQRGGTPTALERVNASWIGKDAVKALLDGEKGVMIGIVNHRIQRTLFTQTIHGKKELNVDLMKLSHLLV